MENQKRNKVDNHKYGNLTVEKHDPNEIATLASDPRCNGNMTRDYNVNESPTVNDEELKYLDENDFGAVNGRVIDYDSLEYKETGKLNPAWGKSSVGEEKDVTLPKGTIIVQWSYPEKSGTYFCAVGTDYKSLELPNIENKRIRKFYEVTKELTLKESEIAVQPWNKKKDSTEGTGTMQWRSSETADDLVKKGIIKKINLETVDKLFKIDIEDKPLRRNKITKLVIMLALVSGLCLSFILTDTSSIYTLIGWIISTLGTYILPLALCSKFPAIAQGINSKKGGIALLTCILFLDIISIFSAKIIAIVVFIIVGYWVISTGTSIFGAFVPTGRIHVERHEVDGSINVEDHYVYEENMPSEMSKIETQLKNEGYSVKKDK